MTTKIGYLAASGPSLMDCHIVASRYDEDTDVEGSLFGVRVGNYRDVWRAPSGVVDAAAYDHIAWSETPSRGKGDWTREPIGGLVRRIRGIGEDLVFGFDALRAKGEPLGQHDPGPAVERGR
jgi:hypothetical protein